MELIEDFATLKAHPYTQDLLNADYNRCEEVADSLKESLELFEQPGWHYILAAYTDYGGYFMDRAFCKFVAENVKNKNPKKRYVKVNTIFCGENLVYGWEVAEYGDGRALNDYLLADIPGIAEDWEEFYYAQVYEACKESAAYFLGDEHNLKAEDHKEDHEYAMGLLVPYVEDYAPQSDGTIDFSWEDATAFLKTDEKMEKILDSLTAQPDPSV